MHGIEQMKFCISISKSQVYNSNWTTNADPKSHGHKPDNHWIVTVTVTTLAYIAYG